MKKIIPVIAVPLVLAACASQPVPTSEAIPVPADQVVSQKYSRQLSGTGEVVVKRDSGFGGSACSTRIFIDGDAIANINVSEKITSYLTEGEHIISASPNSICGGGLAETKANIKAGSKSTYRVGYGTNGDFFIHPTAF